MDSTEVHKNSCMEIADAAKLSPGRVSGSEHLFRCPNHDDRNPSLSINPDKDVWICTPCRASGNAWKLVAFLRGIDPSNKTAMRQAFVELGLSNGNGKRRIVKTYDYRDKDGTLLFQTVRYEPKDFRQRRPDGSGGWIHNLKGVQRVPYRLDLIHDKKNVWIVEGEKDADFLSEQWNLHATTNPLGAGKWQSDLNKYLSGKHVNIIPDYDEPGRRHAEEIARQLSGIAESVRIVELPGLPDKGDISDWAAAGHDKEEFERLVATIPPLAAEQTPATPTSVEVASPRAGGILQETEPCAEPVDGALLVDLIIAFLKRFLVLPKGGFLACALWVIHSFTLDAADCTPLLAVVSPERRCGKTTLLSILFGLTNRPLANSNITPAALFRAIEKWKPTLLVDEWDSFGEARDELRGVINSGHNKTTAFIVRCEGANFDPKLYSTWAPKALALIGVLPPTLTDRSIVLHMTRRTPEEKIEKFRPQILRSELDSLRSQIKRWSQDHIENLRKLDPALPEKLHDRSCDNWRPLFAIAEEVGGSWPLNVRQAALLLSGDVDEDSESKGAMLLRHVFDTFAANQGDFIPADKGVFIRSSVLVDRLTANRDTICNEWRNGKPITVRQLAAALAPFDIRPKQDRVEGEGPVRGYYREHFADAFRRYVPNSPVLTGTFGTSVVPHKVSDASRTGTERNASSEGSKPALVLNGTARTDSNGERSTEVQNPDCVEVDERPISKAEAEAELEALFGNDLPKIPLRISTRSEINLNAVFSYARNRYEIFLRKERGEPKPWTDDPIFQNFSFTNVFRIDDKTTRWFQKNYLSASDVTPFGCVAFRLFNKIETGERLLKLDLLRDWNPEKALKELADLKPLTGSAYRIHTPNNKGLNKLQGIVQMLGLFWKAQEAGELDLTGLTCQEAHRKILQYRTDGYGPFYAWEAVSDLSYTSMLSKAPDLDTWAYAGPGCARGLSRVLGKPKEHFNYQRADHQKRMLVHMREILEASRLDQYWPKEWNRPWALAQVEFVMCEVDKYLRTKTGEGKAKKRYPGVGEE